MGSRFEGRVVVVTGAVGALGSALAQGFALEGATVAACFRGEVARWNSVAASMENEVASRMYPYSFDVNDTGAAERSLALMLGAFGHIDVLVNNAGINDEAPFMALEDERFDAIVATNFASVRKLCAIVARPMMARRSGSIINISSTLGVVQGRGSAAYAASKAALNRFTEVAAVELGRKGVRVNAVAPGLLEQGMNTGMHPQAVSTALDRTPLGRAGTLSEVVNAVLFLASSEASYITGHILTVDGGLSCG